MTTPSVTADPQVVARLAHLHDLTIPMLRREAGIDTWVGPLADDVRELLRIAARTTEEALCRLSGTIPSA